MLPLPARRAAHIIFGNLAIRVRSHSAFLCPCHVSHFKLGRWVTVALVVGFRVIFKGNMGQVLQGGCVTAMDVSGDVCQDVFVYIPRFARARV